MVAVARFCTSKVAAIAVGCLVLSDPLRDGTHYLQSRVKVLVDFASLIAALRKPESDPRLNHRERARQQALADYL
jgi:hypothetical protein